ncbi:hypothetical protein NQZ68_020092 [Dissostichus eleginoides]|nr:hypothetical protein NQZ68_020092 [Dissostichus eleginoides]
MFPQSARPDEVYQSLHPLTMDEDQVYSSLTEGSEFCGDEASQHKRLCWGKSDVHMLRLEHCVWCKI